MYTLALLAGGLATRMAPWTQDCPKALLEVAGKPFVLHQLAGLRAQGIQHVVICIGHLGDQIRQVVGDGGDLGLRIQYISDGARLLGTGGALRQALPLLGDPFFVQYGDTHLPIDYAPVAQAYAGSGKPALMTVLENGNRWDQSNAWLEGGVLRAYQKASGDPRLHHIDYGLSILSREVLETRQPGQPFDLADLYTELASSGKMAGHEVFERFYEIGSPQGLQDTDAYLRSLLSQHVA